MKIKLLVILMSIILALCMLSGGFAAWEDRLEVGIHIKAADKPVEDKKQAKDDMKNGSDNAVNTLTDECTTQ